MIGYGENSQLSIFAIPCKGPRCVDAEDDIFTWGMCM